MPIPRALADTVVLQGDSSYKLGGHFEILRDVTGVQSFDQVRQSKDWRISSMDEPNPAFQSGVFWARFGVQSLTDTRYLVVFRFANVDLVDLFVVHEDGRMERFASGNHIPFMDRSIPNRYPLFPLNVANGETVWCYMQVRNEAGTVFPLSVMSEEAFRGADYQEQLVTGIFIGLFIVVMLFNIIFFFATGDWSYLSYTGMVLFYLIFEFALRDLGGEYIWPAATRIDDYVMVCSAAAAIVMGVVFTLGFLRTRTYAPRTHRVLWGLLVVCIVNLACTFIFPIRITVLLSNALLLVTCVALVPIAISVLVRGYRAARFYLAAWISMLAGGIVFGMFNFGMVPGNLFTTNSMAFGAAVQVILLSSAALDRILLLRRDREAMQWERIQAVEKRLYFDQLTEMPNRNRLMADLRGGSAVTIGLVNIDHFKEINGYFGQKAGDFVITELGRRIGAVILPRGGKVYRLHADEFAAVVETVMDEPELNSLGRTLMSQCQDKPYLFESETLRLDVSIGLAVAMARHLEKVDMALSESKARKTYAIYRPELEVIKKYADNLHWLHVIRDSIDHDRIVPFFQPILDNSNGRIDKFESLMRIRTPNGSVIPPGAFLTVAKKSKIYPELSRLIIGKTACLMRGLGSEVSLNITMEDIMNPDVRAEIDRATSDADIARRIVFEILESEGIDNYEEVSRFIESMKARGSKIAIDDFGTGYSNFAYILRLRVDYLKIDASLIKPIAEDKNACAIVETIVSFARKLGIHTIAEYVHNRPVQELVRHIGVDFSQGYYIGEPKPELG